MENLNGLLPAPTLQVFFERLQKKHARRSYAEWSRVLGYESPRTVAMALSGYRLPSPDFLQRVGVNQRLGSEERAVLQLMLARDRSRQKARKLSPKIELELEKLERRLDSGAHQRKVVAEDQFRTLADWYHLPLKQLLMVRREMTEALAQSYLRIKLPQLTIMRAFERLERLGIARRVPPDNTWHILDSTPIFNAKDIPSEASREHLRQMMRQAADSLETVDVALREFCSLTLSFDRRRMTEAKEAIREFRDRFDRDFSSMSVDSVYQLNIQLFPHTKS